MSSHLKAAVWLDHQEARIFHVDAAGFDEAAIAAPTHHFHRHPTGAAEERKHPDDLRKFLREVTGALGDAEEILIFGPSTAKLQLLRHLHEQAPAIERKVLAVETVDHPTDRQLIAFVKHYFKVGESKATAARNNAAV